jgi:uncharacterized membrane protein
MDATRILAYGLVLRAQQVKIVALIILVIAVSGGLIAFQTGEGAEETVENIVGISEATIEEHEESAEKTMLFFYALGILSCISVYFEVKQKRYAKQLLFMILAVSVVTFSFVARTASLGGKIRHTELSGDTKNPVDRPEAEED